MTYGRQAGRLSPCGTRTRVATLVFAILVCGCGPRSRDAGPRGTPVLAIDPFDVVGQDDGAEFVGRAFAESIALGIRQAEGIVLAPRTGFAGSGPDNDATHLLTGSLTREGEVVRLDIQLRDASSLAITWQAGLRSEIGDFSQLAACATRRTVAALDASYPKLFENIGNAPCQPENANLQLMDDAITAWRRSRLDDFVRLSSELVVEQPLNLYAHAVHAAALAQAWDAAPVAETLAGLKHRLSEMDRLDPSNPYADILLAYVYRSSGEPEWAIELCGRLLERSDLTHASRSWILRQRSYASLQIGEAAQARLDAEQSVRLDPTAAGSHFALSRVLESLGDLDGAMRASTRALELEPLGWHYHQRLGLVLARLERPDEAIFHLDRGCELSRRQDACANRAVALYHSGRGEAAKAAAAQAELLAESPWGLYNLACYRALAGQRTAAIDSLQRALELGFSDFLISTDPDLDSLRGVDAFESIVAEATRRFDIRRDLTKTTFPWQ